MNQQVLLQSTHESQRFLLLLFYGLLVVRESAPQRSHPAPHGRNQVADDKGHPTKNRGIVLLGLSQQRRLLILRGDYAMSADTLYDDATEFINASVYKLREVLSQQEMF